MPTLGNTFISLGLKTDYVNIILWKTVVAGSNFVSTDSQIAE